MSWFPYLSQTLVASREVYVHANALKLIYSCLLTIQNQLPSSSSRISVADGIVANFIISAGRGQKQRSLTVMAP